MLTCEYQIHNHVDATDCLRTDGGPLADGLGGQVGKAFDRRRTPESSLSATRRFYPPCYPVILTMSDLSIAKVSVEHYESALGIDHSVPRLSWRFDGSASEWVQQKYDIKTENANGELSQTITSADSVLVPWPFEPLGSRSQTKVSVRAHGETASTAWASVDVEAGLLCREDWKAELITGEQQGDDKSKRPFQVMKKIHVPEGGKAARLYVTALGVYEIYINGQRVGEEILAPGWTQYKHQLVYRTHDVTHLLRSGQENIIGAWVGEGWYAGRLGFAGGKRDIWGSRPALLAQLEVDGEVVARTDDSWTWKYGSILESSIYDGETCDTSISDDWSSGEWRSVESLGFPDVMPTATQSPPVREIQRLEAVQIITTPSGKIVVDFGQNFAGYVDIIGTPPNGTELKLTHSEVLEHGEVNMRPLRTARCQEIIHHKGEWKGYKPKFTFHGFR